MTPTSPREVLLPHGRGHHLGAERIAYAGWSYGAQLGAIACGAEPRFKAGILISGSPWIRDSYRWAQRSTTPVLMLSGRYDSYFPLDEVTVPYFEAFATPAKDKRLTIYEGDHLLSGFRKEMIRDSLAWLDEYLGPVARKGRSDSQERTSAP